MATGTALDLHVDDFETTWQLHLADKENRNAGYTEADAAQRAVAEWADLIDDFLLSAQLLLRGIYRGAGNPEGVQAAPIGALYLRTTGGPGSTVYVKEANDGANTGWAVLRGTPEGSWANVTAANFSLNANWGTGATVAIAASYPHSDQRRGVILVTAGSSPGVSPVVTFTFPTPRARRPFGYARQNGGSGSTANTFWAFQTTSMTITFGGTPVNGLTYQFFYMVED